MEFEIRAEYRKILEWNSRSIFLAHKLLIYHIQATIMAMSTLS